MSLAKHYYGSQTELTIQNFPFPIHTVHKELIYAIVKIKKAAAIANGEIGQISNIVSQSICQACDEVLAGKFDDQFVTSAIQGGAGTSINMNVNEVLANRASEILASQKYSIKVHPNDHVNCSQSTNDVNPSALKIVAYQKLQKLIIALESLIGVFNQKALEFKNIKKLARTHIQDAVPTTLGAEMQAYSTILDRNKSRLQDLFKFLIELNLGGTAIGNEINAPKSYQKAVYKHLAKIIGIKFVPVSNKMSQTSSQADFVHVSSLLTILAGDMSKIAKDLRFLASGPNGGIGEIVLENLQAGSSIMPGKVNPVIPEAINQVFYFVAGNHDTIQKAAEDSHLELGIMFPILADSLITSLNVMQTAVEIFAEKCVKTMKANLNKCTENLEKSTAFATLLTPILGYDKVSEVVKIAIATKKTIREVILDQQLMTEEEFEQAVKIV